ncbi:unnamed protein product [Parnassius apollo]|uniref:(apollo) hypothetical protein n=1 Tax=Parnassius apollo TaxID=110799 RepID=A0A8S3XV68_PARAO|nr:unnamed protein product [Parnassius apollo]
MPSMKVEGDSDGDGDMSGGETERSGGSSRGPDRDSSAEEADEPDSDDSSEMDESECERRRNECLDNLANLERQFTVLREQLYNERVKHVEYQLAEVRGGRSQEYLGPLRRLQENMRVRIEVAGILKQMRIENIKHIYEAEEQAAHQHFKAPTFQTRIMQSPEGPYRLLQPSQSCSKFNSSPNLSKLSHQAADPSLLLSWLKIGTATSSCRLFESIAYWMVSNSAFTNSTSILK